MQHRFPGALNLLVKSNNMDQKMSSKKLVKSEKKVEEKVYDIKDLMKVSERRDFIGVL